MRIELTEAQQGELRELLRATLADLSSEIADTDNVTYRSGLRERRVILESVLTLLDGEPGTDPQD
jgi:hypothetical protein